jgi:gamma-glutamyltranspeptidase
MDIDSNFSAARANGASPARRSPPAFEALLDGASLAHLRRTLHTLPGARSEAVARARKLIADPDYPPPQMEEILARHLAVQLTAEIGPFPT